MPLRSRLLNLLPPSKGNHQPIFIIGHGRSGTTWIGETIGLAPGALYYSEPCRTGTKNPEIDYPNFISYHRPGSDAGFHQQELDKAFSGKITRLGAMWQHRPQAILNRLAGNFQIIIKEVATVMSVEWVHDRYRPQFLVIFRHPCAVALSEHERNIDTTLTKKVLLGIAPLFEDQLGPFRHIIEEAQTPYEILGAVWGARNRVLQNFVERHQIETVWHYEQVAARPDESFETMFRAFGLHYSPAIRNRVRQNSTTESEGFYTTAKKSSEHIARWKKKMTPEEVEQVMKFATAFNLPFYKTAE